MNKVRLGLIGGNIAASQSPLLHQTAGRMVGLDVRYDLIVPAETGRDFDEVFAACRELGYRGLNITYPFKERVLVHVRIDDPVVCAMGACNTVVFSTEPPSGANTDCSGFVQAFKGRFKQQSPGRVALAGAGGVGKAIAFGLGLLRAHSLVIFDPDRAKSAALTSAATAAFPQMRVEASANVEEAMLDADGLVNATPIGMGTAGGSAFPAHLLGRQHWAFDAVYTPVNTAFVLDARSAGLAVMSGFELFLYQGIDAFRIFTGHRVDADALRLALDDGSDLRRSA